MRKSKFGTLIPVWVILSLVGLTVLIVGFFQVFGHLPNSPIGIIITREPQTSILLPSSTVTPALSATSTVTPTVTASTTPTQTPTSIITLTPTATPYAFTDTIEDAWYISRIIGEEVKKASNCKDAPYNASAYAFSTGECFLDFGDHEDSEVLSGPYYLGLFHEMNPRLELVQVRFYVFKHDVSYTHLFFYGEFARYIWGSQPVTAKNNNWAWPLFAWEISPEAYYRLVGLGREFDKDFWFVVK